MSAPDDFPFRLPTQTFAKGLYWPPFHDDWEVRLDRLQAFKPRGDDIVVVSYPKSGHHWSHEFLSMLLSGSTDLPEETKSHHFLEWVSLDEWAARPSPRLILTHLPFEFLPPKILANCCKIIRIIRNPKDVCVSFHNHFCALTKDYEGYNEPLSNFFPVFMEGYVDYGSYFDFEKKYHEKLHGLNHVLTTTYERLKQDHVGEMKKMGAFLGLDFKDEFCMRVAKLTSFKNIKGKRDKAFEKTPQWGGRSMYRKGQVGDWINHFTVAQNRTIDFRIQTAFEGLDIPLVFEQED